MTISEKTFELSVIVPTLDEVPELPALFSNLAAQTGITMEIIISDGGSTDGTCSKAAFLAEKHEIPLTTVSGTGGRGAQLNSGAVAAKGDYLLFLHADSRFTDRFALRKGVDSLAEFKGKNAAAKFSLRFAKKSTAPSLAYYFYESKARLLRPECTHGDQGLMMHRQAFMNYGPIQEFPSMLAETRLSEKIRSRGELLLIPAELVTSARRFENEGIKERQILNAILMNCAAQGWDEPFRAVAGLYRHHARTGRLPMHDMLETIYALIKKLPDEELYRFWKATGIYVRQNAWQIAYFMDVRQNFKKGAEPGSGSTPNLDRFDRYLAPRLNCRSCDQIATALTRLWFNITRKHYRPRR